MTVRVWVERAVGLLAAQDRRGGPDVTYFAGRGHAFVDCTDRPCPTIMAGRPIELAVTVEDEGP